LSAFRKVIQIHRATRNWKVTLMHANISGQDHLQSSPIHNSPSTMTFWTASEAVQQKEQKPKERHKGLDKERRAHPPSPGRTVVSVDTYPHRLRHRCSHIEPRLPAISVDDMKSSENEQIRDSE
jgi:hypothetical protein